MFDSPKGAAKAVPKVVQLFLLMLYFCVRKRILDSQFTARNSPIWHLEIVRMDGMDGNQKSRLNFFVFKYVNKHVNCINFLGVKKLSTTFLSVWYLGLQLGGGGEFFSESHKVLEF